MPDLSDEDSEGEGVDEEGGAHGEGGDGADEPASPMYSSVDESDDDAEDVDEDDEDEDVRSLKPGICVSFAMMSWWDMMGVLRVGVL